MTRNKNRFDFLCIGEQSVGSDNPRRRVSGTRTEDSPACSCAEPDARRINEQ